MTTYSIVIPTEYGEMIVNRYDINQTNALIKTGRAIDHQNIEVLRALITKNPKYQTIFLDIGANFGTYSLALAPLFNSIHAFEAQRIIANMFAGSIALNSHEHIHCYNFAVGKGPGLTALPKFNYSTPMNFGSVEFGPEQKEKLSQERQESTEEVVMVSVDCAGDFGPIGLIKIDVEGMELDVLKGAEKTIRKYEPVLFVEFIKSNLALLRSFIEDLGYANYHFLDGNLLCLPPEVSVSAD